MVAFGQQATQLVGVLPLMGAGFMGLSMGGLVALSAGLGIAIPLITAIGAAFMRTGEDADSASEGLNKYQQALEGVKGSLESLQTEINKLEFGEEDLLLLMQGKLWKKPKIKCF
jgi:alanine-alpha-ketoisovalerate/valine-pyruvate aminotransferase